MIIIKKYRNRRFYNSSHSCYIRLPEIQKMVQDGEKIQVLSHPEGEDLTRQFLLELVLEKTQLIEVFSNFWLEKLVQRAGTEEEERLLNNLRWVIAKEEEGFEDIIKDIDRIDDQFLDAENAITSEQVVADKKEIIEYVEEFSKGIPIKLEPEDLLELGWEEHSDTEEVEETQVSFLDWEDKTAERVELSELSELSAEKTVEKIESIPEEEESDDSKEIVIGFFEDVIDTEEKAEEKDNQSEESSIVIEVIDPIASIASIAPIDIIDIIDIIEEDRESLYQNVGTSKEENPLLPSRENEEVDVLEIEAQKEERFKENSLVDNEKAAFQFKEGAQKEETEDTKEEKEEKALSQKELLQAKLAALKAKLGQS